VYEDSEAEEREERKKPESGAGLFFSLPLFFGVQK
jgi:hypothetical protein